MGENKKQALLKLKLNAKQKPRTTNENKSEDQKPK